ncbi:MAG TPA: orotate phosphoribosyltransferase [Bacteriovoracaceae bacterium]|nr:orotate phosphoribosyltransferase [Bacteriovoracaceae bacterium]
MSTPEIIARILLKEKAVFLRPEDPFTWTSGIKSPVYCDNRLLFSTVESREIIVDAFVESIKLLNVHVIAGTATAGIPWASFIAMKMKLPLIYVRSSSKEHGRQNAIEGQAAAGSTTVLVEDLISTGKSSIAAAQRLEEAGLKLEKVMSIFTYGFPQAEAAFNEAHIAFSSLSNFDILAQTAFENKQFDEKTLGQVLAWRKSVKFP